MDPPPRSAEDLAAELLKRAVGSVAGLVAEPAEPPGPVAVHEVSYSLVLLLRILWASST